MSFTAKALQGLDTAAAVRQATLSVLSARRAVVRAWTFYWAAFVAAAEVGGRVPTVGERHDGPVSREQGIGDAAAPNVLVARYSPQ
jgi:hypothetical protein